MRAWILPSLLIFPAAADADAEAPADSLSEMEMVEVVATRPTTTVGGASALAVEVDSLALPAAASMEDLLRELPLIHVRTNSRGEAEISARGSESRQVAILVDGVPITLAWDARADVSVIPATALQEATFVRGLSSMLFGPNVIAGVVEARVGRDLSQPPSPATRLTFGADHLGSFGTTLTTTRPYRTDGGQWLVRAGAGFRDTPGDPLAHGIAERPGGDEGLRLNTDAQDVDGFAAIRYRANDGRWASFSGATFRAERGIAAELGADDADVRFWRYPRVHRTLAVVSGGTGDRPSPFGGRGDVEASVGLDLGRTDIDSYSSAAYDEITEFENGKDRTVTARLLADQTLGRQTDLRSAFTFAEIRHDELVPGGEFEYRQHLWSGGLETTWRAPHPIGPFSRMQWSVGGAWDVADTREAGGKTPQDPTSEWGGRVGFTGAVTSDARTSVHASLSRRGRFPALRELYSGALNRFVPNPDLKPEKIVSLEGGVTHVVGRTELQAVGFHHRSDDVVVRVSLPERKFQRVNRDRLRTAGLELVSTTSFGRASVSAHLVAQDVRLIDGSTDEKNEPENLPELTAGLRARFPLGARSDVGGGVEYIGRQFAIDLATGDDTELAAAALVNVWVRRTGNAPVAVGPFTRWDARIAVDNLADEAHYDQAGLPRPGRRFRFELRLD
ncbi:MAG: TonB-dependent receptor [bacterium]